MRIDIANISKIKIKYTYFSKSYTKSGHRLYCCNHVYGNLLEGAILADAGARDGHRAHILVTPKYGPGIGNTG